MRLFVVIFVPFYAFIGELVRFFSGHVNKFIIWFSSGVFGLSYATFSESPDITRIISEFELYTHRNISYLFEHIISVFQLQEGHYDFVRDIVLFLISRISHNPKFMLFILAIISGLLYALVLSKVVKLMSGKIKKELYLLGLLFLVFLFPTQVINQFRFWSASLLYIWIVLNLFETESRKKTYLNLALFILPVFIHIGMLLPIAAFMIGYLLVKVEKRLILIIILITVLLNLGLKEMLEPIVALIGGSVEDKFQDYTSGKVDMYLESFKSRIWYASYWREVIFYSLSLITAVIVYQRRKKSNVWVDHLLSLNLIFIPFAIMMQDFYMHYRYLELFAFVQLIILLIYLNNYEEHFSVRWLRYLASPIFILILLLKVASIMQMQSFVLFINNYIIGWFYEASVSMWSYIDIL